MPMNFPDYASLKDAARVHKFREPRDGEPEIEFRTALADHVRAIDFIESEEIRNGVGWDRFTDDQNMDLIQRQLRRQK